MSCGRGEARPPPIPARRSLRRSGRGDVVFDPLGGKSLARNGWPFDAHGKRRFIYDPEALPASVELMNRTLVYQVPVNLNEQQRDTMLTALSKAAAL